MKLQFLGTGAGIPAKARNVSSLALKLLDELNEIWLFDCGEATQHQILQTAIRPRKITNIFITHMHGDHIFGLPGLLSSRSFQGGEGGTLTIYGPQGIRQFVQQTLRYSKSRLSYPLNFVELEDNGGVINLANNWRVEYLPLNHGIQCFGYRIIEPDTKGELLVDQLQKYNIPNGPIFGQLKRGEIVELADGTVIDGKDFVGPDREGRIITILGDTRPCLNLSYLAQDANVLVHEATYISNEADMAASHGHSTNLQAAEVAKKANVKMLFLNHISARYLGNDVRQLEKEAQAVFKNTRVVSDLNEYDLLLNNKVEKIEI